MISAYVPQIGRNAEEKNICGDAVCDLMVDLKMHEIVGFVGDLNGHVVKRSYCNGGFHVGQGVEERNIDGARILELVDAMEMIVCETHLKNDVSNLVTYRSRGSNSTIDHLMIRKVHRRLLQNAKAIPGKAAVAQLY